MNRHVHVLDGYTCLRWVDMSVMGRHVLDGQPCLRWSVVVFLKQNVANLNLIPYEMEVGQIDKQTNIYSFSSRESNLFTETMKSSRSLWSFWYRWVASRSSQNDYVKICFGSGHIFLEMLYDAACRFPWQSRRTSIPDASQQTRPQKRVRQHQFEYTRVKLQQYCPTSFFSISFLCFLVGAGCL